MSSKRLGHIIKRFNTTMEQVTVLLSEQSKLGYFNANKDFVLNMKQYSFLKKALQQQDSMIRFSKRAMNDHSSIEEKTIPFSRLLFQDDLISYNDKGVHYTLKLKGISSHLETVKHIIDKPFSKVKIHLDYKTNGLVLSHKVSKFLLDNSKQLMNNSQEGLGKEVKYMKKSYIPLSLFEFEKYNLKVIWKGQVYKYRDERLFSIYNEYKALINKSTDCENNFVGTTLHATLYSKKGIMWFEDYDIYDFFNELFSKNEKTKYASKNNSESILVTDTCTIDSLFFGEKKYTIVFKYGSFFLKPYVVKDPNCTSALNIVCDYLKDIIPSEINVQHEGDCVKSIITTFKLQEFVSILASKKNDKSADYWGIIKNVEKRSLHHITNISKHNDGTSLLRKNEYIDILTTWQSPNKLLLLSYEVTNKHIEEDSFIFTHRHDKHWIVIMENINPKKRATEVFVTNDEMYEECISHIFEYFTNYEIDCKRKQVRQKRIDASKFHAISYHTVDHKNVVSWLNEINSICSIIPKNDKHFVFKEGLRIANHSTLRDVRESTIEVANLHDKMIKKH